MRYLINISSNITVFILSLILTSTLFLQQVSAQNPFMPPTAFIPDGEPHLFEYNGEKRLFVYGSRDERITGFCGFGHDVWSAPVQGLSKWRNHGEIFNVKQVQDIGYGVIEQQHFGAPDCVFNPKTKKYYLYTFLGALYKMDGVQGPLPGAKNYIPGFEDWGPKCVMASSDSPAGPFVNPILCDWSPLNKEGAFDPSVIVDEQKDGSVKVYAYWGMKNGDRWAEVDPEDMHTIINPKTQKPDRNAWHKTLDIERIKNSSVFEASSIKKIDNDHYVFIYSSNEMYSALSYCYSSSPKGPWTYGGRIVNNAKDWKKGNNHGSIAKVLDQWYVVYHKPTTNGMNRQAMVEPIDVKIENEKVVIPQVEMTSQGISINGLDAFKRYNANIACFRTNNAYIDGVARIESGLNPIKSLDGPSTTIGFKYFNFGTRAVKNRDSLKLKLNCKVLQNLRVKVFIVSFEAIDNNENRVLIGEKTISSDAVSIEFKDIDIPINKLDQNVKLDNIGGLKGKMALFVSFIGEENDLCELVELEFAKGNNSTPNPLQEIKFSKVEKIKLTAIPLKARVGESVKIILNRECENGIKVQDENGKAIEVFKNGKAPYALESFNFFMPNSAVLVRIKE